MLAEDVFQDTFLKVHEKIGQYQAGRPARPWLYTIATHQAVDALRRAKRRQGASLDQSRDRSGEGSDGARMGDLIESREESPTDRLDRQEQADALNRAIDSLPDLYREVLILAYFQEMKYQEIADVLGLPLGTVKSRMHAAVGKLSELLRPAQADGQPASPALQPAGVKR